MPKRTVLVVPVEGPPTTQVIEVGTGLFDWLYATCDTRMIEHQMVAEDCAIYGDEEGRMHGQPVNDQATALVQAIVAADGNDFVPGWDTVGTIVFVGAPTYTSDDAIDGSVPDRVLDLAGLA